MAGWFKGTVKAVPSGDSLVIMGTAKEGIPPEKSITLSSLMAPRLARRDTSDEPFAWDSREFLRNKCIGKEVTFKVDYAVANLNNREFGSVFMDDANVALAVASAGWAKVRQGAEKSPFIEELLKAEEQARQQGLGIWNKEAGERSIRSIPPSAIGDTSTFDARALLESSKGKPLRAFVEQVRDGSSFRVYLLPSFQFVQVHLAGVQAPSMGRRVAPASAGGGGDAKDAENGEAGEGAAAPTTLTTAQKLAASTNLEAPEEWAREAKHFTECRILHREVIIVLEGTDKFNTLFGSVKYKETVDLALELLQQGLAKYAEWSANMLEEDEKRRLKAAELQAKKDRLRLFAGFVPQINTKAIKNDVFTGQVIEVTSADCIVVADDAIPLGRPNWDRRVNLSSIQAPKRTDAEARFREAKEFLRSRLIGQQVRVFMEYSRTITTDSEAGGTRLLEFGSVFLSSAPQGAEVFEPPLPGQPEGFNVAELVLANGHAQVVRHRDFDDRSHYYDNLVAAERKSQKPGKKGTPPSAPAHINDLTMVPTQTSKAKQTLQAKQALLASKARQFLPFLQRARRLSAVVDFVLSGHRYKLFVPKETCLIFFSLSGVRCPGKGEPYSDEALAFMRRRVSQRDVEIEVETADRTGTFLGSLYEGKVNVGIGLLEAGLAKLQPGFAERITDGHLLMQAEEHARTQRLKIWENVSDDGESEKQSTDKPSKQEVLQFQVQVTQVLAGGSFYVQEVSDTRASSIQQQLESLSLSEKAAPAGFTPERGQLVLANYDGAWYRGLVVNAPKAGKGEYEVFYIDYGNQEVVPLSQLRPIDPSVAGTPGLAQWCSLAHVRVPGEGEEFCEEAAEFICTSKTMMAKVEGRDASGGKVKGQGSGTRLIVTLVDVDTSMSVNAGLLEAGLARVDKAGKWDSKEKRAALEVLAEHQEKARKARLNIWQYGDVDGSDDEDKGPGARRGGRK
ncbi:ribonuclease TUDOR 1 isoform X1 [Selaginella moellendorffii]|uniref:ribonuclease TUDOR 1 isoform X1 n=1 Tax=Selaginella moellendorffii TaxID=88036 RepID=UPI000D1CF2CA|nr:ribonuclease TUDOR 1 isoform X1 [Selaginella moellendorffii]|eukprot:XP_024522172.1 ribonuclease TUDOR 1 isoform X1 [Selaginella moellendorffii]